MSASKNSYIFSVALLLGFFLPEGAVSNVIQGILPFVLFSLLINKRTFSVNKILLIFVVVIIISFIINSIVLSGDISLKSCSRLLSFVLIFITFPFTSAIEIPIKVLYFAVLFILFSQVAYVINISFLVKFFDGVYPYTGDKLGSSSDFLLSGAGDINFVVNRRYGGLFHNPNQCSRYISALMVVFLIQTKNKKEMIFKVT